MGKGKFARLCIGFLFIILSFQCRAQTSLSTEQFMSALGTCAVEMNVKLDGNVLGSIRSFYEGSQTQGRAVLQNRPAFLNLFPEADRVKAYNLYLSCVSKILNLTTPESPICAQKLIDQCRDDARISPDSAIVSCKRVIECDDDNHLAHGRLGQAYRALRRHSEAEVQFQKQMNIGQKLNDRGVLSMAYYNLARLAYQKDAYDSAESYVRRSLEFNDNSRSLYGAGANYEILGRISLKRGDPITAEAHFEKAVESLQRANDKRALGSVFTGYSMAKHMRRDRSSACLYLQRALSAYQESNHVRGVDETYQNMTKAGCSR